ncbi:MAG: YceI family protein [Chromatiaceae bacterium]|nr:YceI family protein [Chromatiaceae bacterium]MCP5421665.1 YceI family protein [Chromatiaceae bacterium]
MPGITRVADGLAARLALLACLLASVPVLAATQGQFGYRAVVEGQAFETRFTVYRVTPAIDERGMPFGFDVEIDLRAIDSGDGERDAEMRAAEWFDVESHPTARYRSTRVTNADGDGWIMQGELTVKGVTRALDVPFTWQPFPTGAQLRGVVSVDRRWFGVGPADEASVGAFVEVAFDLRWEPRE